MSKDRKTKYCFTEYVNHMIRFYLSTPNGLKLKDKSGASIANWMAVQRVLYKLPEEELEMVRKIYAAQKAVPVSVDQYCKDTGEDPEKVWAYIVKLNYKVARYRGLV